MKKHIIILAIIFLCSVTIVLAQAPPPPPSGDISELGGPVGVPIDGGAFGLIAIGAAFLGKKFLRKKKK